MIRANDCCSVIRRKIGGDFSRNRTWLFFPCAQCAAQRVDDAPFYFVHDLFGQIFEPERGGVVSKLMSKRCLHEKLEISICRRKACRQGHDRRLTPALSPMLRGYKDGEPLQRLPKCSKAVKTARSGDSAIYRPEGWC